MSDLYSQVQDIDDRVNELETTPLSTDINYDTMTNLTDFMNGNFWYFGQTTLVAGSSIITLNGLTTLSKVLITPTTNLAAGGTGWHTIAADCTQDTLTITSSSAGDTRAVNYWVII